MIKNSKRKYYRICLFFHFYKKIRKFQEINSLFPENRIMIELLYEYKKEEINKGNYI